MDFFVNALGDVFAWVFLVASAMTLALMAASVAAGIASIGTGRWMGYAIPLMLLAIQSALVALFGLVGEYVQRVYRQSSGRPFFLVRRMHDVPQTGTASVFTAPGAHR